MGEQLLVDGSDEGAVQVLDRAAAVGGERYRDPASDALPSARRRGCRRVAGEDWEVGEEELGDVRWSCKA